MYRGVEPRDVNRRAFLAAGAGLAGVTAIGTVAGWDATRPVERTEPDPSDELSVDVRLVMEGTDQETPLYRLDAEESGPTVMVFGGVHGDEINGYLAAEQVAEWTIDRGTLVVVPWADVVAIDAYDREGDDGDLNRQFPPGKEPTSALARALWDEIVAVDPDAVLDLHRSRGIYGTHAEWVGQVVFPTPQSIDETENALASVNDEVVPWTMPAHEFVVGDSPVKFGGVLVGKVGQDLDRPGYVIEVTEYLLDVDTQVRWTLEVVERLLAEHGIGRVEP